MPFTFNAEDDEFGVATGSNVYTDNDGSRFDQAPENVTGLAITSDAADTDPRLFSLGESYSLSWSGGAISDAEVVRSDLGPGNTGTIVFEGLDQNGDLAHVVWAPGSNINQWYLDNNSPNAPPGFYVVDLDARYSHRFVCFEESVRLSTLMGEMHVSELWEGDKLITLEHGAQPIEWIGAKTVRGYGRNAPVLFSPGALGNHAPLRLSQQHRVLVNAPMAELLFGEAEVFVPAKALINGTDVRLAPCHDVRYMHVLMAQHEIVLAEGMCCETLLMGDMADDIIAQPALGRHRDMKAARPVLTYSEALTLFGKVRPVREARLVMAF